MWALWTFGNAIHDVIGREHFLAFYVSTGALAGLTSHLFYAGSRQVVYVVPELILHRFLFLSVSLPYPYIALSFFESFHFPEPHLPIAPLSPILVQALVQAVQSLVS